MEENKDAKPPQDLGGLQIPAATSPGSGQTPTTGQAAEGVIQRRRGRPPGSGKTGSGEKSTASVPTLSQEQFRALYSPELWARISTAPADAMAFSTGKKYWEAGPEEKKTLGETTSIAVQCFAVTDPRWLAAAAALVCLANFYGMRIVQHAADKRAEREAKEKADKK